MGGLAVALIAGVVIGHNVNPETKTVAVGSNGKPLADTAVTEEALAKLPKDGWLTNGGSLGEPALLAARPDQHVAT